ncbi:MAG: DUF6261 family protein [Parabacteroides sp.]|nr:DUF6261 family protein [Parabacteroides sp.]
MGTYTKIKPAGLTKLNNAEYTNFMNAFYRLAFTTGGGGAESPDEISLDHPLGITDAQKAAFEKEQALITDLVNQSHISDETALLLDLDKQRDDLVVYSTTAVSQMRKSPIEAQRAAAQTVYNIIKPYIGIYSSPNQQETAQIQGLLQDLSKEGIPALIQTLGLKEIVDSLRVANDEYAKLTAQRTGNKAASIKEASTAVRLRMDDLYDDMTTIAFVQSVSAPTAATARFVSELNTLIDETTALYNLRVGAAKAAAKRKE